MIFCIICWMVFCYLVVLGLVGRRVVSLLLGFLYLGLMKLLLGLLGVFLLFEVFRFLLVWWCLGWWVFSVWGGFLCLVWIDGVRLELFIVVVMGLMVDGCGGDGSDDDIVVENCWVVVCRKKRWLLNFLFGRFKVLKGNGWLW